MRAWRYGAIIIALFVVDRGIKWCAVSIPSDTGWFFLSRHLNTQGPFSLPLPGAALLTAGIIAAALIVHFILRSLKHGNVAQAAGLMLMLAGGASNLFDRLWQGGVTDVFYLAGLTFNLADVYLLAGVAAAWAASRSPNRP